MKCACAAAALFSVALAATASPQSGGRPGSEAAQRIVSLVPAITEMLFAIGAGTRVVGVSSFDRFPPDVDRLPRVGALIDPDTERILSLRPDLVMIYGSQAELRSRFERAGIRTYVYRHAGVEGAFETIEDVGGLTGRTENARRLVADLRVRLAGVSARVAGRPRPRTLLVFERQPGTLRNMYVSGGVGFLHEMLTAAGGINVFADVRRESVQPSQELVLARAPEVILEVRAAGLLATTAVAAERDVWRGLSAVPAVRSGRLHFLTGEHLVVPGPRLAEGAESLARALHPEAFR